MERSWARDRRKAHSEREERLSPDLGVAYPRPSVARAPVRALISNEIHPSHHSKQHSDGPWGTVRKLIRSERSVFCPDLGVAYPRPSEARAPVRALISNEIHLSHHSKQHSDGPLDISWSSGEDSSPFQVLEEDFCNRTIAFDVGEANRPVVAITTPEVDERGKLLPVKGKFRFPQGHVESVAGFPVDQSSVTRPGGGDLLWCVDQEKGDFVPSATEMVERFPDPGGVITVGDQEDELWPSARAGEMIEGRCWRVGTPSDELVEKPCHLLGGPRMGRKPVRSRAGCLRTRHDREWTLTGECNVGQTDSQFSAAGPLAR